MSCILIRSYPSSMQLKADQCNSARQWVSLWSELNAAQLKTPVSCLVFWSALIQAQCSSKLLNVTVQGNSCHSNLSSMQLNAAHCSSTVKAKAKQNPLVKENYHKPQEWMCPHFPFSVKEHSPPNPVFHILFLFTTFNPLSPVITSLSS